MIKWAQKLFNRTKLLIIKKKRPEAISTMPFQKAFQILLASWLVVGLSPVITRETWDYRRNVHHRVSSFWQWTFLLSPYSSDLSPKDFFLWGYVKGQVHRYRLTIIEELKNHITSLIAVISIDQFKQVIANFEQRLHFVTSSNI